MGFIGAINKMKNGDWAGLGADALSAGAMLIPGVGPLVAAGIQAGTAALKGEGTGSIIKAAGGELVGFGAGKAVGKLAGAASKVTSGIASKVSAKVGKGVTTGGAGKAAGNMAGQGYVGTLPNLTPATPALKGSAKVNVINPSAPALRGANVSAPTPTSFDVNNIKVSNNLPGNLGPKPDLRPKYNPATKAPVPMTRGQMVVNTAKKAASNAAGQVGLQGILSIASGVAAAKQANAANEVSKQGLLFQKETYERQKADEEKYKAKMKEDAYTAYTSSSLFGENLTAGSPSNNLLTDSTSGPGIYSILNTGVTTRRSSDLT